MTAYKIFEEERKKVKVRRRNEMSQLDAIFHQKKSSHPARSLIAEKYINKTPWNIHNRGHTFISLGKRKERKIIFKLKQMLIVFVFNVLARRWRSSKWQILYLQNMRKGDFPRAIVGIWAFASRPTWATRNITWLLAWSAPINLKTAFCVPRNGNNKNVIIHHVPLFTTSAVFLSPSPLR